MLAPSGASKCILKSEVLGCLIFIATEHNTNVDLLNEMVKTFTVFGKMK
jgi:hypothetical protein